MSRCYYAAFSAVTAALVAAGASFPPGYETPPHQQVPHLIENHLTSLPQRERREVRSIIRRLYNLRLMADYRLLLTTDAGSARRALSDVVALYRALGANYG